MRNYIFSGIALLALLLIGSSQSTIAQIKPRPSGKLNAQWFEKLKTINSEVWQLRAIRAKLYNDTLFRDMSNQIVFDAARDPRNGSCKIMIVVCRENEYHEIDLQGTPALKEFVQELSPDNIRFVQALEPGPETAAFFGTTCGVVVLHANRDLMQKVRACFRK